MLRKDSTLKNIQDIIQRLIIKYKGSKISTKEISDKYHTFGDLYHHRAVLFSVICNQNKDLAWKSLLHSDGTMFDGGMFVVGIETPEGNFTYHYKLEYWDMYKVKVLDNAPKWDGHSAKDIGRLTSLIK